MSDSLIEKVQKLLALAGSSNEHEATAAAEKAQAMMLKHGLDLAQVDAHSGDEPRVDIFDCDAVQLDPWRVNLASRIAMAHSGRVFYERDYRKWSGSLHFAGPRGVVESMVALYVHLERELDSMSRIATAEREERDIHPMTYRRSWLYGAATRIGHRLALRHEEAVVGHGGQSLVLLKTATDRALEDIGVEKDRSRVRIEPDAYRSGVEAGARVPLGDSELNQRRTIAR